MNKSMHALALLTLFAGAASAQSTVTIYGKIDQGLLKDIGSKDRQIAEAAGSRLGFKGTEDLGGGLSAVFAFEHRFTPDSGNATTTVFWNGISVVGLKTPYGTVNIGRQYTPAFSYIQNQIDPFGGDTVAELRTFGMRQGAITKTRVSDSVRYDFSAGAFTVGASIAEASQAGANAGADRPFSIAGNYAQGPLFIGVGYEDPANTNDDLFSVGARYAIGSLNLATGFSTGTRTNNTKAKGFLVGLTYTVGAGEIKGGFARESRAGVTFGQKIGVGYHHNLSKRTKLYADVGYDKKATTEKTGYDLGIQHNF